MKIGSFGTMWIVLGMSMSAPAFAAPVSGAAVDALLAPKSADAPGVAVVIYQSGKIVYLKGYGLANLEQGTPVTTKTRFNVASVSKEFTALAIAMLAQDGKLDLDADVRRYLPWLPDFGDTITVNDLIHHLAGFKDSNLLYWLAQREDGDHLTQAQLMSIVKRQRSLLFKPGTQFSYSNTGYALLAEVVKAVSGQSLRQFTEARIFGPLGMTDSVVRDDTSEVLPRRADAYQRAGDAWRITLNNSDDIGATGVNTTAEDMGKWLAFLDRPTIGGPDLLRTITTPGKLRDGTPLNYAFGLYTERAAGRDAIGHSGSTAGFRAQVTWIPKDRFGVVLIANGSQDLGVPTDRIIELYLGKAAADPDPARDMPAPIATTPATLASMTGHYLGPRIWSADLVVEAGKLYWTSTTLPKAEITIRGNDVFSRGIGAGARFFRFDRDAKGAITSFRQLSQLGTSKPGQPFVRIAPVAPSPAELAPLAGDYHAPELDISYSITLVGKELQASSLWSTRPIRLVPVAPDRFDTTSIPLGSIAVRRDAAGKPIGFEIVGGGLVGTRLDRRVIAQ
jgi:CubicO group peptidase (beta-lactamase class C family)